jgi:CHRD domain/PEP-CTERM motif
MKKRACFIFLGLLLLIGTSLNHAVPYTFTASLDGASENPSVSSAGTGVVIVILDDEAHTLSIDLNFGGLTGYTTTAHIHCCTVAPNNVGIATPSILAGFPFGVTSGTYSRSFDTTQSSAFSSSFLNATGGTPANAESALLSGLLAGNAYFNIHTNIFPAGEIRGFLTASSVPEPGMLGLILIGLGAIAVRSVRRSF